MANANGQIFTREGESHIDILTLDRSSDQVQPLHPRQVTTPQEIGLMSPPPKPESLAPRAINRLSLSLPIQAGERDAGWLKWHVPTDSDPSTWQTSPSLDGDQKLPKSSSNVFLVALAAQERRVLELKEELHRAESQLKKLKQQWALHEASSNMVRSSAEDKQVELQQTKSSISGIDCRTSSEEEDQTIRRGSNVDVDRRKAILACSTKGSRRKIITGGHTRTLSLLSPTQGLHGQSTCSSHLANSTKEQATGGNISSAMSHLPKKTNSTKTRHSYQGNATIGVKQIAEDIKSGLWTFMEDLRQAAVGDEAIQGVSSVNAHLTPRRSSKKGPKKASMAADQSFSGTPQERPSPYKNDETEKRSSRDLNQVQNLEGDTKMVGHTPTAIARRTETTSSLDDDWSNWDSPVSKEGSGRWSNSTALSSQDANIEFSSSTELKSSQSTVSPSPNLIRDEVAWPTLDNFIPSNIKRTASAALKEWEKSLKERKDSTSGFSNAVRKTMDEESKIFLNSLP